MDDLEDGEVGEFENFAVREPGDTTDDTSAKSETDAMGNAQGSGDDGGDDADE